MNITILSIGKFAHLDASKEIFLKYHKRLSWKVDLQELELKKINSSKLSSEVLKAKEGELLLTKVPIGAKIIALDERGKMFSSPEFAAIIKNYGNLGQSNLAFIIGGADGLSENVRKQADLLLSLSKMTFPHLLIRAFLMEQIYRCSSIISNHPYHRI